MNEEEMKQKPLTFSDLKALSASAHAFWRMPLHHNHGEAVNIEVVSNGTLEVKCHECLELLGVLKLEGTGKKFFLDQDNSSHWYVVDAAYRTEWEAWTNLSEDDEASWEPPAFAERLDGGPNRIEFTAPETR